MHINLQSKIKSDYNSMSKTHRIIAELFLSNKVSRNTTLVEISQMGYCSHSTVMRFIKSMGYQNFKVFIDDYFNSSAKTKSTITSSFELVDTYIKANYDEVYNFILAIVESKNIYIFANGMSHLPAYNLYYKGNMIVKKFKLFSEYPSDLIINDDDIIIFISNSGNSRKLKVISEKFNEFYLISNCTNTILSTLSIQNFCLNNTIESFNEMDTKPRESIYSLIYFTDYIFELLNNEYI